MTEFFYDSQNDSALSKVLKVFNAKGLIEFDNEEMQAINSEIDSLKDQLKDKIFQQELTDLVIKGLAAHALLRLAKDRLKNQELQVAVFSCIKSLSLLVESNEAWLLLAEIMASIYGRSGYNASRLFVDKARQVYKQNQKVVGNYNPSMTIGSLNITYGDYWESTVKRVLALINEKKRNP